MKQLGPLLLSTTTMMSVNTMILREVLNATAHATDLLKRLFLLIYKKIRLLGYQTRPSSTNTYSNQKLKDRWI